MTSNRDYDYVLQMERRHIRAWKSKILEQPKIAKLVWYVSLPHGMFGLQVGKREIKEGKGFSHLNFGSFRHQLGISCFLKTATLAAIHAGH